MELYLNDLSFHGQFQSIEDFKLSMLNIMKIRKIAKNYNHDIRCDRKIKETQITHDLNIKQAVQTFKRDEQQAIMQWFTKIGPFWDDDPKHSPDDYLLYNEEIVTDTTLGEVAFANFQNKDFRLISLKPSQFNISPILVKLCKNEDEINEINILNYWEIDFFEKTLKEEPPNIGSWNQLELICKQRFQHLIFLNECFQPIKNHSFNKVAVDKILNLLDILNQYSQCFDEKGNRNKKGNEIYKNYFTGENAYFTDSSETEKSKFKKELTFPDPNQSKNNLFCTWHGKFKSSQPFRIHFSDIKYNEPIYIAYIGTKITKR